MDEAAAIDGSRPLEQIADSSGYAVGGVALQMKPCLTAFSILATHSRVIADDHTDFPHDGGLKLGPSFSSKATASESIRGCCEADTVVELKAQSNGQSAIFECLCEAIEGNPRLLESILQA